MKERTGWQGQGESQIVEKEKKQTCWCCRDQQRECKMAQALAKILEYTEPAEKKRVASMPQREQLASSQTRLCQKGKEQSRLSRASDRKEGIQCQRGKENSSKGKEKRRVFLCRRTVRVEVKSKVLLTSFPNFQGRETFVGTKNRRKRDG